MPSTEVISPDHDISPTAKRWRAEMESWSPALPPLQTVSQSPSFLGFFSSTPSLAGPLEMREVIRHHVKIGVDQIKLSMSGEEV
jgi:hypothetical protein